MGYNLVILCSNLCTMKKAFLQVSGMLFYYSRLSLGRILLRRGCSVSRGWRAAGCFGMLWGLLRGVCLGFIRF